MTLKISYPDIFDRGIEDRILYGSERFGTTWRDAINGDRISRAYVTTNSYFLAAVDIGSGVTDTPDHLILTHIGAYAGISSINAYMSNTSITVGYEAIPQLTISSPSSATGIGPRAEDYLLTRTSAIGGRRYFAIELIPSVAVTNVKLGKIYLGTGFDMGNPPAYEWDRVPEKISESFTTSGNRERTRTSEYRYTFRFQWEGITDAKVASFMSIIEDSQRDRYFLYTTDYHHILNDERLVHVRLVNATTENPGSKANWNTVNAEFEELIG